jgi:hypothetical protein
MISGTYWHMSRNTDIPLSNWKTSSIMKEFKIPDRI